MKAWGKKGISGVGRGIIDGEFTKGGKGRRVEWAERAEEAERVE